MLTHLALDNFVLIDALDLEVNEGLCVITGETGAGKSILLTALGLVTGARVQAGLIGPHRQKSEVTAVFQLPNEHPCLRVLKNQDISVDSELVLRRTIGMDGRTKAFVNSTPVAVSLLSLLGRHLVEIQGQFEQLEVLKPQNHRVLLDQALNHETALQALKELHSARESAANRLKIETKRLEKLSEDQEYLVHCLDELEVARIEEGEAEELVIRRDALRALSAAEDSLGQLNKLVQGDRGVIDQLARASKLANRLPSSLEAEMIEVIQNLEHAWNSSESAAGSITSKLIELEGAEQELEEATGRLFFLKDLSRKHNCQPQDLLRKKKEIAETLKSLEQGQSYLTELKQNLHEATESYMIAADELSRARRSGALKLSHAINTELPELKLPDACVSISVTSTPDEHAGIFGYDHVRILVKTNRGTQPGPIEKVASGGELSRILLALKLAILPNIGPSPLLIFDEADSGIGGATATALGSRLRRLAGDTQVISVTHSPQVAAAGNWHLKVTKVFEPKHTGTRIHELSSVARTEEIARMLAGSHVGKEALEAASALRQEFAI